MIASPPGLREHADGFATGPAHDPARYVVAAADVENAIAGGEGLVYRARHAASGRAVALKLLTATTPADFPQVAARAELLTDLGHRNLMVQLETFLGRPLGSGPVVDYDEFDVPYSVSAWVDGTSLAEAAETADVDVKLRWIADLAAALDHLHIRRSPAAPGGLVHRDVKPSNIRIAQDGRAVLLDFGVARAVDHADMTAGIGTYRWRAPEVLSGSAHLGTTTDVWGLGAVAHWLLVGDPPHLDGSGAARERMIAGLTTLKRRRARAIARHIARLLESSPDARPHDLAAWRRGLTEAAELRRRRVVPSFASSVGILAVLAVVAGSQQQPAAIPPPTISCSGGQAGPWSMSPPVRTEPGPASLEPMHPEFRLMCSVSDKSFVDPEGVYVHSATVDFPDLSCDINAPAPAAGTGEAWLTIFGDPRPARARLTMTPPEHGTTTMDLTIETGAWSGYAAAISVDLARPTGGCGVEGGVVGYSSAILGSFILRQA